MPENAVGSFRISASIPHPSWPLRLRQIAETWWREPLPAAAPALHGRRVPYLIEAGMLDLAERNLEWFNSAPRRLASGRRAPHGGVSTDLREWQGDRRHQAPAIRAVDLLREQMPLLRDAPQWQFGPAGSHTYFAAMKLAEAMAAQGNLPEAIAMLEQAVSDRVAVIDSNTPNRWLRANAQLASLYRRNGQEDQARTIEARLVKLLAHGDADHPLALQLKRGGSVYRRA